MQSGRSSILEDQAMILIGQLVELGHVVASKGVLACVPEIRILNSVFRHAIGDWGELEEHDWKANDAALEHGFRLTSVYHEGGVWFCIVTEADRSVTNVRLPDEVAP
jgi:hypothetical protein